MNRLTALLEVTKQLEQVLDQPVNPQNRESIISAINTLVEKRSACIKKLVPPYTEDEKQLGRDIVQRNEWIQARMNTIFDELKQEMKQINKQKSSKQSYTNPYKHVQTMDGMFVDRKK
ncbi:MAG TPA: flagellar protein FliT [Bacillota bacterium]|nr:flagellar protein FliT [Bacillota bacterium]